MNTRPLLCLGACATKASHEGSQFRTTHTATVMGWRCVDCLHTRPGWDLPPPPTPAPGDVWKRGSHRLRILRVTGTVVKVRPLETVGEFGTLGQAAGLMLTSGLMAWEQESEAEPVLKIRYTGVGIGSIGLDGGNSVVGVALEDTPKGGVGRVAIAIVPLSARGVYSTAFPTETGGLVGCYREGEDGLEVRCEREHERHFEDDPWHPANGVRSFPRSYAEPLPGAGFCLLSPATLAELAALSDAQIRERMGPSGPSLGRTSWAPTF